MKKLSIIAISIISLVLAVSCDPQPEGHKHTIVHELYKAPTCIAEGHIEYYHCSTCGLYFADREAATEISSSSVELPMIDHVDANTDGRCDICHLGLGHVNTFEELANFVANKIEVIILDNDISWNPSDSHIVNGVWAPDMTGIILDLNGHAIKDVPCLALNFKGKNFTIQNGSILSTGDVSSAGQFEGSSGTSYKYSFAINYIGGTDKTAATAAIPARLDDSDNVWSKRVKVYNITGVNLTIGPVAVEVKGCTFTNNSTDIPRALVFQGASGIVENCNLTANKSSGLTAYGYGKVWLRGENKIQSLFGIHVTYGAQCIIDSGKTTAKGTDTYGLYFENEASTLTVKNGATLAIDSNAENIIFSKNLPTTTYFNIEPLAYVVNASGTEIKTLTVKNPTYGTINDSRGTTDTLFVTKAVQLASIPSSVKKIFLSNNIDLSEEGMTSTAPLRVNMNGKTLDLCGYSILNTSSSVTAAGDRTNENVKASLVLYGSNFTIKNGTVQSKSAGGYGFAINDYNGNYSHSGDTTMYNGTSNAAYSYGQQAAKTNVTIENITMPNCGLVIYDTKNAVIRNCNFTQPAAAKTATISCMYSVVDVYGGTYNNYCSSPAGAYKRWIKLYMSDATAHNGTVHNPESSFFRYITDSMFRLDKSTLDGQQPERRGD